MIEYKNGRFRSYRPKEEKSALLKKQLEELPAKQRAALSILIKEATLKKQNNVANVAEQLEWDPATGPAVPIRQWVNDKYYLGELADSIFPKLKEDMIELFEGDYYECILTGSTRWGKDFFGTTALIRVVYELYCLKSPTDTLGLGKGEMIHIIPISHMKEAARRIVFQGVSRKLHLSPFWKGRFEETNEEIRFPGKNIIILGGGSNENTAMGFNLWSSLVDECVTEDTQILTPSGYQPISALHNSSSNDELTFGPITTYDEKTGREQTDIGFIRPASETKVFEVAFDDGRTIKATEGHPFLLRRPSADLEYAFLKDLKPGDEVIKVHDVRHVGSEQSFLRSETLSGNASTDVSSQITTALPSFGRDQAQDTTIKSQNKSSTVEHRCDQDSGLGTGGVCSPRETTFGTGRAGCQTADVDARAAGWRRGTHEEILAGSRLPGPDDRYETDLFTHSGDEGENRGRESQAEGHLQAQRSDQGQDQRIQQLEGKKGRLLLPTLLRVGESTAEDGSVIPRCKVTMGEVGSEALGRGLFRSMFPVRIPGRALPLGGEEKEYTSRLLGDEGRRFDSDGRGQAQGLHLQRKGTSEGHRLLGVLHSLGLEVRSVGRATAVARVVSVRSAGRRKTFDVMSLPGGNFIANGLVVHNSNFFGKSRKGDIAAGLKEDKSESIYDSLRRRIRGTYAAKGFRGKIFLVSSKKSIHDFTERRLREAMRDQEPGVFVRDYATWDVRPNAFPGQKWWNAVVNQHEGRVKILGENEEPKADEISFKFPDEYYRDFQNDPEGAARDIAGIALESFRPFFSNRQAIDDMQKPNRPHPFHVYEWDTGRELKILWENLVMTNVHGDPVPRCCPNAPRHCHIDLSKNKDATGFVVGHNAGEVEVSRLDPETHTRHKEEAPFIHIDLALRIKPPRAGEIEHQLVRSLIYKIREGGIPIKSVTADTWMGLPNLQMIAKEGFETDQISTQRTLDPYLATQSAMYERRIETPVYPLLAKELRELELNDQGTKIDHPKTGSKDISDAFAATVYFLATHHRQHGGGSVSRGSSQYLNSNPGLPTPTADGNFRWPDEPPVPRPGDDGADELPSFIIT